MTYYDDISEGYEELHRDEQLKKIDLIKQFLKPKKSDKLLDVGCGSGLSTRFWDCKRFGVDPAKELIKKARKNDPVGEYIISPAEDLPFPDNQFDIVISVTAIQNFEDVEQALSEIKRVAKKDAKIVITCLKKSEKLKAISVLVKRFFKVVKEFVEDKDIVFFLRV